MKKKKGTIEDFFPGLRELPAIKILFPRKRIRERVFRTTKIIIRPSKWYAYIRNGILHFDPKHLRTADRKTLYLDIIHETVHVKQLLEGKNLYDMRYNYFERPTEVEAYKFCVKEARRIGMSKKEIVHYLKVDWVEVEDFEKMLKKIL